MFTLNLVPAFILLAGVIDDLRSRKIHNQLIVGLFVGALIFVALTGGWSGLVSGAFGFAAAILFSLPLVLAKAIGGGDLKLLAVFGLSTNWAIVGSVLLLSLVWGALLGIIRAALRGELALLLYSTAAVATRKKPAHETLQKIPYSVALFLAWLTYLSLSRLPGGVL